MILKAGRQLINSTKYSLQGLMVLLKNELAARLEVYGFFWTSIIFLVLGEPKSSFLTLLFLFGILLSIEALNTAIETIVDHISPDYSEAAKNAKDLGSFAVMCILIVSGIFISNALLTAHWSNLFIFTGTLMGSIFITILVTLISFYFFARLGTLKPILKWCVISFYALSGIGLIVFHIANYFTGEGFNESVFYHLSTDLGGAGLSQYWRLTLIGVTSFIGFIACIVIAADCFGKRRFGISKSIESTVLWNENSDKTQSKQTRFFKTNLLAGFSAIALLLFANPFFKDIIQYFSPKSSSAPSFVSEYYAPVKRLPIRQKRNIVVIYAESLERTYLDGDLFPGLMPNLSRLEKDATSFSKIGQVYGTGWTIAGLVATQCGVPLYTLGHVNQQGRADKFMPEALCLGDILKSNGYNVHFSGGADLAFAGKGNFLKDHGFNSIHGKQHFKEKLQSRKYFSGWGLKDDTLLSELKTQYYDLKEKGKPFAIFGLTVDTHHPNGLETPACIENGIQYEDGESSSLNAVACADWLIGNFVDEMKAKGELDNTILVVLSDHFAMKNQVHGVLESGDRQNLFYIFDDKPDNDKIIDKPGSTLDFSPTLLSYLGIKNTRFGFGINLMGDQKTLIEKMPENHNDILLDAKQTIGLDFWNLPNISNGFNFDEENTRIALKNRFLGVPAILTLDSNDHLEYVSFTEISVVRERFYPENKNFVWIDYCSVFRDNNIEIENSLTTESTDARMCWLASNAPNKLHIGYPLNTGQAISLSNIKAAISAQN